MNRTPQAPQPNPNQTRPTLFFVLLGLIAILIAAFLILHPHPSH